MIYAYARVSTTEQNLDRQHEDFKNSGYQIDKIIDEKFSGETFNNRTKYQALKKQLRKGDTLIISSIDRLGRDYNELLEEWGYLVSKKQIDIVVLDMPILNTKSGVEGLDGRFIGNIVLQILAYVSQKEREQIKKRQRDGINSAKKRGVKFGRPRVEINEDKFQDVAEMYLQNEIDNITASYILGITRGTFFRRLVELGYGLKGTRYDKLERT